MPMKAEEVKGWNVFKQIFSEHWEGFKNRYPRYSEGYYEEQAERMSRVVATLRRLVLMKMGMWYIGYLCMSCGQGSRVVSMRVETGLKPVCTTLCLRCGKV